MAILLDEPEADSCALVMAGERDIRISAGTLAEALIVAGRRSLADEMSAMMQRLNLTILPVTADVARRAADAYSLWGKGVHPAALNLGDCFAYAAAKEHDCPLLYVGADFARTDLTVARP